MQLNLDQVKILTDIAQNVIATLAIVIAGVWGFYTFVLGRAGAPNIQIQVELRRVIDLPAGRAAIILVTTKNIGRTRVWKKRCYIAASAISLNERLSTTCGLELRRIDAPFDVSKAMIYSIFESHSCFEPGESSNTEILFALSDSPAFKVWVEFIDRHNIGWSSDALVDIRPAQQVRESQ